MSLSTVTLVPNQLKIDVTTGKAQISRHIYGHFSEHLGRCIYEGYWVGEDSPIPNTHGIRNDVVAALRELDIPNLRWPGGCFADEYHWMDGIGPREQRPKRVNTHWGGVTEDNRFGTHEFMDLCEQLGCEPVICGNLGSGTVQEMSQWIEYLTSDNQSPVTELRKRNGREKPWKIKFWDIGNENWGCGGNMRPKYYADEMRRYSTYCRNFGDSQLYKIACGPNSDLYEWTETLMRDPQTRDMMQGLSLHYYTVCHEWENKGSAIDFTEDEWALTMDETLKMDLFLTRHAEIMDKYDPGKKIGLIVDEWGNWHDAEPGTNPGFLFQQNTLRDALVAGINLNIFNNHCHRVKMANIAQTINVLQAMLLTRNDQLVRTPSFYVFKLYRVHHDATLLPSELNCELYQRGNISLPALSASASKAKDGKIHISLCNLNPDKEIVLQCKLNGSSRIKNISGQLITALAMNAFNDFDVAEAVKPTDFRQFKSDTNEFEVKLPGKSVVMLEIVL